MESPADTCAVAAAIVGLTEQRITDLDALAKVFSDNGFSRDHVGSTIRTIHNYAALLKLPPSTSFRPATSSWWKRLFG